jgi:putative endonuclease
MDHNELGSRGESLAVKFLEEKGLRILETNWRYQRAEVDIIAMTGEILVFVEVKTRTSDYFGPPETFVTPQKEKLLVRAAHAYMEKIDHQWEIRFDVVSILHRSRQDYEIRHLPDAFWPGSW